MSTNEIGKTPFFHVGIVVEDIEAAMAELSAALGVRWRKPNESKYPEWTVKVVLSIEGPPFLELIEGGKDEGPWDVSGGPRIDHIGYYSDDVMRDREYLAANGLPSTSIRHLSARAPTIATIAARPPAPEWSCSISSARLITSAPKTPDPRARCGRPLASAPAPLRWSR